MRFETVTDTRRIADFLESTPVLSAYLLSYLDPAYAHSCTWYEAADESTGGSVTALLLIYEGLSVPAVIMLGREDASAALLRWAIPDLPSHFYAQMPEGHVRGVLERYRASLLRRVVRMAVIRQDFRAPADTTGVERVGHEDTADLMELYQHYPDAFFEPYQLETGFYYGVRDEGRLVSVAGVHSVSKRHDIAVIGNAVTHPSHRNRGLSTRCTGRLLQDLFELVGRVALNVEEANGPARRTYEKLGFTDRAVYVEGYVELR